MCTASHIPVQAIYQNLALGKSSSARLLLLVLCSCAGIVWKYVKSSSSFSEMLAMVIKLTEEDSTFDLLFLTHYSYLPLTIVVL